MGRITSVAGIATAAAVTLFVWFICGWGGESTLGAVSDYGAAAFAAFAAMCAFCAARWSRGRQRIAWIFLTVGVGGWAIGSGLWTYYELGLRVAPFPSLADAGYLLFPLCVPVGLALLPAGHIGRSHTRLVLDGLIVATAFFAISWVTVLESVYDAGATSRFALGLSLAYPVGDVLILTLAVLVLSRARTGQRLTLILLATGAAAMALSDSAFAYLTAHDAYRSGTLVDLGWVAGMLLIGLAGLLVHRRSTKDAESVHVPSKASLWLPYVPVAVAAVVCAPDYAAMAGRIPLFVSTALLVIAVLARQFFVVRENRRLLVLVADQALRDPLTGLANRALFNDRLTHAMQLHQRDNQSVAVLSLDLDDFKLVNDSLGHAAGDTLLMLTAERILGCVRTGDTVARLGGDEFAVLLEGNVKDSRLVANRVAQAFDELFLVDGRDLLLRSSFGLAVASAGDTEISADVLLKQADVAMYSAKRSRTGGVHAFTSDMHVTDLDQHQLFGSATGAGPGGARLLGQLRHAIDNLDLSLVYQPKLDLGNGEIVGVEALVRWPHPERGLLGPDHFLPMVREHGLMRNVTELVLAQALDDAAAWRACGVGVPIAVNVFAPSVCDLTLPDRILQSLDERKLSPDQLTIEITEDMLLDNMDRTHIVLECLRSHGIRIAIDDFGSGYSSLSYLCELPIDEVKLDRRFIAPILVDTRAAAVVRSVIELAHVLDVTTVAEGVEDAATATRLKEYGCDVAQGFHYSRPVAAPELFKLLEAAMSRVPASARSS